MLSFTIYRTRNPGADDHILDSLYPAGLEFQLSGSFMKKYKKIALVTLLAGTVSACGSDDSDDPTPSPIASNTAASAGLVDDPVTNNGDVATGDTTTATSSEGTTTTTDSATPTTTDTTTGTTVGTTESANTSAGTVGTTDDATTTAGTGTTDGAGTTDDGSDAANATTPSGTSPLGNPPTLADPFADAVPSPDPADPFGALLEADAEVAVAGGPPTTPKFLRVDLVSNDWAEINWAPSNDDVGVVEYRIYRSDKVDGPMYIIREDTESPSSGTQEEIDKYWRTTSFIDCNFTRFSDSIHECNVNGPSPGDRFSYQVSAVDGDGQESPRSNSITVLYHAESNAAVPRYDDFYKNPNDSFAQDHDLSDTSFFLDKFEMVFEDNFDGPTLDSTKWNTGLTWGDTRIINGEQQYFVNTQAQPDFGYDPFKFENGDLIIEAVPTPDELVSSLPPVCDEPDPFNNERCAFLSGALSSHDKFGITYGYVEGRMKVGSVPGMLSSFYMYHRFPGLDLNLHGPEIDIVEYLGENPFGDEDAFQTYHYRDTADGEIIRSAPTMFFKNPDGVNYSDDYHTFGVLWEPQLVIWYIDGKEIKRISGPQVARQQMNIVTYLVAGSAWAPTPADDPSIYPLQYNIDYIRAYQRPEYTENALLPGQ